VTATEVVAEKDPGARLRGLRYRLSGFDTHIGPIAALVEERARLASLQWNHFEVKRMGSTIGAELGGLDLTRTLPDPVIAEIRKALHDYKVIFFRDQPMTGAQHVAFAARFGELEIHPFIPGNSEYPELVRFAKSADVGGYENGWHHDVTWRAEPSFGAVLHAISVPTSGGDTLFSDQYAAYDALDDETKTLIEGMTASHDFMQAFGAQVPQERRAAMREQYPIVHHPVVCTHADIGRKHLYVNLFFTSAIDGLNESDSHELLGRLTRQAATAEYQCRFHWEEHSVAFWDNRAVQHYANSDYWPDVRVMERASIKGLAPRP
jgi:alpha-ketoglutarate-dependent sulfate ester dioxygenase